MAFLSWRRVSAALVVAGIALVAPRAAQAQSGKISGVVTDASNGQPIEGAQVRVAGTGYGALTQANGRYFIINVPPGRYTVIARRVGYQPVETENVNVAIDVTRDVSVKMTPGGTTLGAVRVTAEAAPLVERGLTGSSTTISSDVIEALPVTSISGVLSLQQGFTATPQSTNLQSLSEEQRSTVAPVRVRGGRGGSTISLVDGIPVNNPIFGTEAIQLNPLAVQAIDFVRGYMEPQYGNGLSGVINQATREGGASVAGAVSYQNSTLAGALGSRPDQLNGYNLLQGYLSGPVPGTTSKVRYSVSGQIESGAARVLQFDNQVVSYNQQQRFTGLAPDPLDLIAGWRAFGGHQNQQIVGKLTFLPRTSSSTKLNLNFIDQQREALNYDRRYLLTAGGDPFSYVSNTLDSLGVASQRGVRDVAQPSVRDQTRLYGFSLEQNFGRTSLQLRGAQTDFERNTCNVYNGVCVPNVFVNANFREQFIFPFAVNGLPFQGTGLSYGGEKYNTRTIRADLQSQVTDHHNVLIGASFLRHDITYNETSGISGNSGVAGTVPQLFRAKPIEAASYIQDRIEYDFLTIKLGARFDYGLAKGKGFTNPLDPTNGTTAKEVCNGTAPGLNTTPYTYTLHGNGSTIPDSTFTGVEACNRSPAPVGGRAVLLDSATRVAQRDDFIEAKARKAFSPRIGVSFPLTERSSVFFNAGRYTMNPLYSYLYRNSGVGTVAGSGAGADKFCSATAVKPGTTECVPPLTAGNPQFIGNPNLRLEEARQYEVGYGAEFANSYSVNVAVYNRDESGLSGLRRSKNISDIGVTYAGQSQPTYQVIVNQDFLTARGLEVQFRRRMQSYWGYDINYGWSRATTNSPPPDRAFEIATANEVNRTALREVLADIDQPNKFNATLLLGVRNELPNFRYASLLRNSQATITYSYASGFPYTPIRGLNTSAILNESNVADINTGRAPGTQQVNLLAQKGIQFRNVRYDLFVRVDNLFDTKNCVQVFVNTGTCDSGLRDVTNRRVGNADETSSTNFDQPEYIGARRSIFTGLAIKF